MSSTPAINPQLRYVLLTFCALILTAIAVPPAGAQTPAPQQPPAHHWPKIIDTPDGQITVYQPQVTNLTGDKLSGRAAVSILKPGQQEPIFGAIWMESRISTDRVARTVQVLDITVTKTRFPDADGPTQAALTAAMRSTLPQQPLTLSLDQLLTMLQVVQQTKQAAKQFDVTPPRIIFRDHASVLVQYDGPPRLIQAPNSNLFRVVNTPFFVVLEPADKSYYLKGAGRWFVAPDPLGPFQTAAQVPADVVALAQSSGYQDPQQPLTDAQAAGLEIVTATDPTELIWTDGQEELGTIPGVDLLYVTNTDSDLFLQIDTQRLYVLLSGRWYTAANMNGNWTYVPPDQLPNDFRMIPPASDKGDVLASVPGTQAAKDAIADTFVPQTAAIDTGNFQQPPVTYDGAPQFQPIEGTPMNYAVNTSASVLLADGQYYCCSDGVWYLGPGPTGPWSVCTSVPPVIYTIPPSCPLFPCDYVYVYGTGPGVVYCGYLPGYVGCYRYGGVVVYGTGFHYAPWFGRAYYGRPCTFGFAARYDPYTCHWGFDIGLGGDATGWVSRLAGPVAHVGGGWFGHGGYRPVIHEDPNHLDMHVIDARRAEFNVYERRNDVRRDLTPMAVRPREVGAGARPAEARTAAWPAQYRNAPRLQNNVFADPNGNIYRRTVNGWDQRQYNGWVSVTPGRQPREAGSPEAAGRREGGLAQEPRQAAPPAQEYRGASPSPSRETSFSGLNREYQARVEGDQRARSEPAPTRTQEARPSEPQPRQAPERSGGDEGRSGGGGGGNGRGR